MVSRIMTLALSVFFLLYQQEYILLISVTIYKNIYFSDDQFSYIVRVLTCRA